MKIAWKDWRLYITAGALAMACVALPFSKFVNQASILALILIWITEGEWRQKIQNATCNIFLVAILVFYLINIIAVLYSDDKKVAYGNLERYFPILFVPLVLATTKTHLSPRALQFIFGSFAFSIIMATGICLFNAFINYKSGVALQGLGTPQFELLHPDISKSFWAAFSYTDLTSAIDIHPGYLALYVCFCIVIIYQWLSINSNWKLQLIGWTGIAYLTIVLLLLSSRVMLIGFAVLVILYMSKAIAAKKIESVKLSLIVVLAIFFLAANPVTWYRTFQEFTVSNYAVENNNHYTNSTEIRLSLWWIAVHSVTSRNFIFGNGTGDTRLTMRDTASTMGISNVLDTHDPHNQFLFTLLATGLFGVAMMTIFLVIPVIAALKTNDILLLGFCILFLCFCMTESALELQKGIGFFSLFSSLLLYRIQGFESASVYPNSLKIKAMSR